MKNRESFEEDEEEENARQSLNCFGGNIKTLEVRKLSVTGHHYNNIIIQCGFQKRIQELTRPNYFLIGNFFIRKRTTHLYQEKDPPHFQQTAAFRCTAA